MNVQVLTKDNFDPIVEKNELLIIEFWAHWCRPCQSFKEVFKQVASEFPEILFASVDIEKENELANDFNVQSIPHIMILRKAKGQMFAVFHESGVLTAATLKDLVTQAINMDPEILVKKLEEQEQK